MPHRSGSGKWKWGNIERSSKEDLRKTVYGIWLKNGGKGSFSKFWKTGRVDESDDAPADGLEAKTIPSRRLRTLLDRIEKESPRGRLYRGQFEKFASLGGTRYFGLFDGDRCMALAVLQEIPRGCVYVAEIQSFYRQCGRLLLDNIFRNNDAVWLLSNPAGGEKLLDYYRSFGQLEEFARGSDDDGASEEHFFISSKNTALTQRILDYIDTY